MINSMEMKNIPLTENQLLLENEELRQRVYEYEETLNSIRNGEIDAIVVSGVDGEKIYSLTSAETKYRIIIEEMNEGAITTSRDGLITYCNARLAELISEPTETLVGSYFINYLQESEQPVFLDLLQTGLKGKIVGQITYKLKNGHNLDLQLSISPIPADIQNGVCILFSDITQLKQQENELMFFNDELDQIIIEKTKDLARTNQELKALHIVSMSMMEDAVEARIALETTNANLQKEIIERKLAEESLRIKNQVFEDSIASQSIADSTGTITHVNKAFLRLWDYSRKEQAIGNSVGSFFADPADAVSVLEALASHDTWEGEFRAKRTDGTTFVSYGLATSIRDIQGKLIGYQSTNLNVTVESEAKEEIRKLNAELEDRVVQRTVQLEAANKELEAFSYSVSHDLRAPLRAVHSFTNILLEDYEKTLDDEGKRICGIISSSATQMGKLIDDLLSFSRIGRSEVKHGILDMKSLANSVINEIHGEKSKDRANLKLGKLSKAYGDSNLIKIVWTNLISNAIKYSSKEPSSEIVISSRQEDDTVTYSVKDNGVGFDMLYVHKLFGVFQRLHSESEFEGNGVGLAIVQRIILKHGGKVWAEGEVDKGATFYFSLPVSEKTK
jgi:PAS domain S-box-containing protein